MADPVRLAYLVSEYPAVSHTFILREIRQLRALGFELRTVSINPPARARELMTAEERDEAEHTFYVKSAGLRAILRAHLKTIARGPLAYIRGLRFAMGLGGADLRRILFGLFYFVEAVVIGRWMEEEKIDHLHVHFANAAATVALIASRTFPLSFSFTMHGPDEFYDVTHFRLKEKIAAARLVCCIGDFARSQLMRLAPPSQWGKFAVVPLGVNLSIFAPPATRPAKATCEILCVGRLTPAKGQHILLEALGGLITAGHQVHLRIVGDGPDRASLVQMTRGAGLERAVTFEGAVNQDRIREFYSAADIFVLPSFAEGIPVVLMEAMAMEVPCISTYVAGIPELIRDGIDGMLVMPSDANALAAAIVRLIGDPALGRRLGQAGRMRINAKYDLDDNVARLAEVFRARLGQR